ncbi:hypothetical protein [Bacillus testis]|uniref:hypothetical protein n=1 Tax=Bacillus testis TaxID=1622072 RepID=UPI000ADD5F64|nr:hypothetical protein [Bacillus testis]
MQSAIILVPLIGGLIAIGCSVWYYASLGKIISKEEKKAGRDLTNSINPFTGSVK